MHLHQLVWRMHQGESCFSLSSHEEGSMADILTVEHEDESSPLLERFYCIFPTLFTETTTSWFVHEGCKIFIATRLVLDQVVE
jgi:hypothetical protein